MFNFNKLEEAFKNTSKVYVVIKGYNPGIYTTWNDAKEQVEGYKGSLYKSFKRIDDAQIYISESLGIETPEVKNIKKEKESLTPKLIDYYYAVDGGTQGNDVSQDTPCEFQIYDSESNSIIYQSEKTSGTNNIAEFLAIVKIMSLIAQGKVKNRTIYSDSTTALKWVKKIRVNTKLTSLKNPTESQKQTISFIEHSLTFLVNQKLKGNEFDIRKWETSYWGENPADYGRK